jgi:hypothetical protein
LLQGELRRHGSLHRVGQAATDGAIARSYLEAADLNGVDIEKIVGCRPPLPRRRIDTNVQVEVFSTTEAAQTVPVIMCVEA